MKRVFKTDLSLKGLRELNKQIREYKNHTLPTKVEQLVNELADKGISVGKVNCGGFGNYIGFRKDIVDTKYNYQCKAIIIAYNSRPNIVRWVSWEGIKEAEVNSLMMAEFGSGSHARGGYRGTFPNDEGRDSHGLEDLWWYATDIDANGNPTNWHMSTGVSPSRPTYWAWLEMKSDIVQTARAVFDRS